MSDAPPDFNALARRYLDLWQEQVAAVAADPALAEAVARGVAMMTQSAAAVAEAVKTSSAKAAPSGHEANSHERTESSNDRRPDVPSPDAASADRPPPAAASSDDARLHHDELALRVAALEKRVARLEAALGRERGGPGGKPGRRRA